MPIQQMLLGIPSAAAGNEDPGSVQFAGGSGNVLTISNSNVPTGSASRTVEFWAYIDSNYSSWSNIFSYGGAGSGNCFGLNIGNNGNTTKFGFTGYSAGDWLTGTEVMPYTDAWHHFAVTYDGTKVELFINGASRGTSNESLNTTGSNFTIGGSEHSGNSENFKGWISNLRVSNNVRYTSSFDPSETALQVDSNTTLLCCHDSTGADQALGTSGSMVVGGGCTARTATPFWFPAPHRYWRFSEGSANGYDSHFPRVARIGLTKYRDNEAKVTWINTYNGDNCSDSGVYTPGVFTYDHGSPITFKYCVLSSVFSGSIRSAAYQIDYSDDNSSWTTAWIGVAHNQNAWPSNGFDKNSNSRSICGWHVMEGSHLGTTNPNNGGSWSSNWTAQGSNFDQAIANAHDGRLRMTDRARTSGNSIYCYLTCNITVENSVTVYAESNYPSTSEVVIDGVTYTTSGKSVHRFEGISGNLTKVSVDNDGQGGRTYIEGVVVDGYLLMDGVGHEGWMGTGN